MIEKYPWHYLFERGWQALGTGQRKGGSKDTPYYYIGVFRAIVCSIFFEFPSHSLPKAPLKYNIPPNIKKNVQLVPNTTPQLLPPPLGRGFDLLIKAPPASRNVPYLENSENE